MSDTTDIVEQLRRRAHNGIQPMNELARLDMLEAAAEITRLRADFAALQHAIVGYTGASAIETAHRLRAALAQDGAPERWQLVPVEPTPWMLQALFGYWMDCINNPKQQNVAKAEYKAMLTAAAALPNPPPAQREPLSDEQIDSAPALTLAEYSVRVGRHELRQFARQIEAACAAAWGVMLTATASGTKGAAS